MNQTFNLVDAETTKWNAGNLKQQLNMPANKSLTGLVSKTMTNERSGYNITNHATNQSQDMWQMSWGEI